ncbi:hypothetical protein BDZ91DRAFT_718376 [Kalaharituber pfeilii]|nr:hypothetical protein BDZ91DRAFT_718376 [Kalaharituber pfeilii]
MLDGLRACLRCVRAARPACLLCLFLCLLLRDCLLLAGCAAVLASQAQVTRAFPTL